MLDVREWAEIRRMHEVDGLSIRAIAKCTGHDRNTIRRALRRQGPPAYRRPARPSELDPHKPRIHELLSEDATIPSSVIRERIEEEEGYLGGKTICGNLGLPIAELPFGKVGLCVCYDLRFVETARALALQGAELLLVPTAWFTGFDRVKRGNDGLAPQADGVVLQANLNQTFIACSSQAGTRGDLDFLGSSVLAGPSGELLLGPLPGSSEKLAIATIDLDDAERAQYRSELVTPRADRRTDVYGILVNGRVM